MTKRYGNLKKGVTDIKEHKWFIKTDWIKLYEKKFKAPLIPKEGVHFEDYDEEPLSVSQKDMFVEQFKDF